MKIVIDPGHGGNDPGASVGRSLEAVVVLPYAFALGAELASVGHTVRWTRMSNEFKTLRFRSEFANQWPADVFISLHCNASASHLANGVWVLHDDNTRRGIPLARAVYTEINKIPGMGDGDPAEEVYPDDSGWTGGRDLHVLGVTDMPAILVELGFLTHAQDLQQLILANTVLEVAAAITKGVQKWASEEG